MRKSNKYYILRRVDKNTIDAFRVELSDEKRKEIDKRIDPTKPLILVEKTCNKDNTESYTDMWLIDEGVESLWTKYTKGRQMYDYTGIVQPLIHEKGIVLTFKQYSNVVVPFKNKNKNASDKFPELRTVVNENLSKISTLINTKVRV
jgi:hypothetical protein